MGKEAVRQIMSSLAEGDLEWNCELMEKGNLQANLSLALWVYMFMCVCRDGENYF